MPERIANFAALMSGSTIEKSAANGDSGEADSVTGKPAPVGLSAPEAKVVDYFVSITKLLGLPKSVGEIYAVLYCSQEPLTVADITAKLGISKATASYALRFLGNINAVSISKRFGNRHDFYTAKTSLRQLASGFLAERVEPFLADRADDLEELSAMMAQLDGDSADNAFLKKRIKALNGWRKQAGRIVPVLMKLFRVGS